MVPRGENADAKRRTELRKLGQAEVEAAARKARSAIQRWEAAAATDLVAQGLTTATAAAWLDALPPAEELLPSLAVTELEAKREVGQ